MAAAPSCGPVTPAKSALEGPNRGAACGKNDDGIRAHRRHSVKVVVEVEPYNGVKYSAVKAPAARRRPARSARGCAAGRPRGRRTARISKRMGWRRSITLPGGSTSRVPWMADGDDRHLRAFRGRECAAQEICRSGGVASKVPSGKNTSDWPVAASFHTRRASEAPLCRSKRSTNSEPRRRSNRLASGTRTISFLMTKAKSGGRAATATMPSM